MFWTVGTLGSCELTAVQPVLAAGLARQMWYIYYACGDLRAVAKLEWWIVDHLNGIKLKDTPVSGQQRFL